MQDPPEESEEEARRLLRPLIEEPTGPSTVDLRRAMADGRRRRRTRRLAGAGAAAVGVALALAGVPAVLAVAGGGTPDAPPPPAAADTPSSSPAASPTPAGPPPPTGCVMDTLPVPGDAFQSLVTGGDPSGRYLAGRTYHWAEGGNLTSGIRVEQVIWDDREPTMVDIPGYDGSFDDINSSGVAVGTSYEAPDADAPVAWVYRDGELSRLPGGSAVGSINERGAIAGSRGLPDDPFTRRPLVWRSPEAEPEELSVPGAAWDVWAIGVDADGTVIGAGFHQDRLTASGDPEVRSFVWLPDGTRRELPLPASERGTIIGFTATSIQDGVVTGEATRELADRAIDFPVFRYDLGAGEFTPLPEGGGRIGVLASNAYGWLVGRTDDGRLVLRAGANEVTLPYPEDPEDSEERLDVLIETISDNGRVVAGQLNHEDGDDFRTEAVAWHCD